MDPLQDPDSKGEDDKIMHFCYGGPDSILSIPSTQDQIIQSNLSQNIAAITERFARNMIFQEADLPKVLYSSVSRKKNDNIDEISEKQASLALSSTHLIKSNLLVANQRIYKIFKPII